MRAIVDKIRENELKFNEDDWKMANFVIQYPNLVENLTINNLSKILIASRSEVFRFTKKIGFSSYEAFKFALKKEQHLMKQSNKQINLQQQLKLANDEILSEFKHLDLTKLCEDIKKTQNIYIFQSSMGMHYAGNYLARQLMINGKKTILLPVSALKTICDSNYLEKSDIFIFLLNGKHDFKNRQLLQQSVRQRGIITIGIFDDSNKDLFKLMEYKIKYSCVEMRDMEHHNVSMIQIYWWIDLLMSQYKEYIKQKSK